MQALLELDCIPAGMELFPAANETQWNFIKGVIADCDYYIVIIAGRYGSLSASGIGYTEMEYGYAEEIGKPTIAFLHRTPEKLPADKTERRPENQQLLHNFREYVQKKLCKSWSSPQELGSVVSRSLVQLMKSSPAVGWIRATDAQDPAETVRLRARIEELETELGAFASTGPKQTEALAQGGDNYTLNFSFSIWNAQFKTTREGNESLTLTWDEIMTASLPPFIQEGPERAIADQLAEVFQRSKRQNCLVPHRGECTLRYRP